MIDEITEQRSAGWFKARLGNFTGSQVGNLMALSREKGKIFGKAAEHYIDQVAGERLINPVYIEDDDLFIQYLDYASISTKGMRWGQEQEDAARQLYAEMTGNQVHEVSSCKHDTIPHFAASPDAIIYNRDGKPFRCLEIKCPKIATFMKYTKIKDGATLKSAEPMYYWQVMAEMECTGAQTTDFVAYNPWLIDPIHIARIERDEDAINALRERVKLANEYIKENYNV